MDILFITGGNTDPASRFRVLQYLPYFKKMGYDVNHFHPFPSYSFRPKTNNRYFFWFLIYMARFLRNISYFICFLSLKKYKIIFCNRALLTKNNFLENYLFKYKKKLVFDFDDAIYLPDQHDRIKKYIKNAFFVTPGNRVLSDFALLENQSLEIIPTVIDTTLYKEKKNITNSLVKVGWSGSWDTMRFALPMIKPIIYDLYKEIDFEFVIISDHPPKDDWSGVKMRFIPWSEKTEIKILSEIDIGIMPLQNEPFMEGKCGCKLLQYMGLGLASVASPVGVNSEIIDNGKNGLLAISNEEWKSALYKLISNAELRSEIGKSARYSVEKKYSINHVLPKFDSIFKKIIIS